MITVYKTVNQEYRYQLKEKGSTFIAVLFPIRNEEEFKHKLYQLRNEFHDASHHCYAFRIDPEGQLSRSSDDGEPSGTAGKPIMNQLLSAELSHIGLIIVRYFGGIKLGTGGLIKAYKEAAKNVIELSSVVIERKKVDYMLSVSFELSGEIMRLLNQFECEIIRKTADEKLHLFIVVPIENLTELEEKVNYLLRLK